MQIELRVGSRELSSAREIGRRWQREVGSWQLQQRTSLKVSELIVVVWD
jgi:hypothetical protein